MKSLSVEQLQADPAAALAQVALGEALIIVRDGQPVARLLPPEPASTAPPGREGFRSYGFIGRPNGGLPPKSRR